MFYRLSVPELESRVRSSIKEVVQADILQENPFAPKVYPHFDAMFLLLVLDEACKDRDSYKQTLRRLVSNYLRSGGMLILQSGTPDDGYYSSGIDAKHDIMTVDRAFLQEACEYSGLEIAKYMEETGCPKTVDGADMKVTVRLLSAYRKEK